MVCRLYMPSELPQVRGTSSISVNFTHRIFPTAARESKEQEEQEVGHMMTM